jgi:hypothetical protein
VLLARADRITLADFRLWRIASFREQNDLAQRMPLLHNTEAVEVAMTEYCGRAKARFERVTIVISTHFMNEAVR